MEKHTKIENIKIKSFRGLKNVSIDFGNRITLICGKNGTSKSTILGIVAQIFSFSKEYNTSNQNKKLKYRTLLNKPFESKFSEHFRFSKAFDKPGSMDVSIKLFDGIENKQRDKLSLTLVDSKDRNNSRPVLRGNNDRNITNPVIYLSVNRLTPIVSRKYEKSKEDYLNENKDLVLRLTNKILLQENTEIDVTDGFIPSLAPHNENYDYESISVGEDNVGQLIRALLSFKQLKENYPNYSGGTLLIDEVDAGLFPAAQNEFFDVLDKFCKEYYIQVIMTSHSPTMIEKAYNSIEKEKHNYKINYLTDTYGAVQVRPDYSWTDIENDLLAKTKTIDKELKLPEVTIYFEDDEARAFFNALIRKKKLRKIIKISDTSLGGDQLNSLSNEKIPEFSSRSAIILDPDKKIKGKKNFCNLPGAFPPDQLLFDFLNKKEKNDDFWKNEISFTRVVFDKIYSKTVGTLGIPNKPDIDLQSEIEKSRKEQKKGVIREKFKNFYKDDDIQKLLNGKIKQNPFFCWKLENPILSDEFEKEFIYALKHVLIVGLKAPKPLVEEYFKKV